MYCENCGGPVDREEVDKGVCTHCGAALPYIVRAAEKAEFIRRVVGDGQVVRVEGDRIEMAPSCPDIGVGAGQRAPAALRWLIVAPALVVGSLVVVAALVSVVAASHSASSQLDPSPSPLPPPTSEIAFALGAPPAGLGSQTVALPSVAEPAPDYPPSGGRSASIAPRAPAARHGGVDAVVASHRPQFNACQRAEVARNPSAPHRYSVAMTVSAVGAIEWVDVLSEASAEMKACVQGVVRSLTFAKGGEGSTRSIITLSFTDRP